MFTREILPDRAARIPCAIHAGHFLSNAVATVYGQINSAAGHAQNAALRAREFLNNAFPNLEHFFKYCSHLATE